MQKRFSFALGMIAVFLFSCSERVFAQSETPKFEVGVQFSLIRFSDLVVTEPGFGGRFTYNINKHVAVEAEGNFFPRDTQDFVEASKGDHKTQALFGIKAGTRSRRVGLFGKIRPGLVNFSNFTPEPCNCSNHLSNSARPILHWTLAELWGFISDNAGKPKKRAPRYEIGVQFSSLSINQHSVICFGVCLAGPDRTYSEPAGGARFTYNLTNNIGLEAEGNLFPRDHSEIGFGPMGRMAQGQFGAKVGKRFERFGVFGKIRPGFVSFSKVSCLISTSPLTIYGGHFTIGQFGVGKERFFSTDVGGVVEFYPSRHLMTRVDLGDTIIRYGEIDAPGNSLSGAIQRVPPETRHNFQFAAGIGLRFR